MVDMSSGALAPNRHDRISGGGRGGTAGNASLADDFPSLCRLREALEMFWRELQPQRGDPPLASPGDADMCGVTSAFLLLILQERGETGWHLRAGCARLFHDDETIEQELGYFDGCRWHSHIWLQREDHVLDMTAGQFGGPAVFSQKLGTGLTCRYRGQRLEGDLQNRLITPMVPLALHWAAEWRQIEMVRSLPVYRQQTPAGGLDAPPVDAPSL